MDSNSTTVDACASEPISADFYSFPWHVGGVFIVLFASGLGIFASLLLGMGRGEKSIFLVKALQLAKMFGIGVIAGTAWIHLLPDAFDAFSNPCLDVWWQGYGTSWVGVFGLIAAFAVQLIELAGHSHVKKNAAHHHHHHGHHDHHPGHNNHDHPQEEHELPTVITQCPIEENACESECDAHVTMGLEQSLRVIHSPTATTELSLMRSFADNVSIPATTAPAENVQDKGKRIMDAEAGIPQHEASSHHHEHHQESDAPNTSSVTVILDPTNRTSLDSTLNNYQKTRQSQAIKRISTLVLEAGILAHSLIIGITLGVTPDASFTTLLIAICFHQLFEGMALGVLVSDTNLSITSKLILGIMYPLTTPIGITIGILIRNSYNASSNSLLVTQGIFDSLSAGILIYNTYCELVGGEINHNPSFDRFEPSFKIVCFLFMYTGAAAMGLVGYWA